MQDVETQNMFAIEITFQAELPGEVRFLEGYDGYSQVAVINSGAGGEAYFPVILGKTKNRSGQQDKNGEELLHSCHAKNVLDHCSARLQTLRSSGNE